MPTSDSRREAIRRTLARRVGGVPDADAVADAAVDIWHQVADRLTPVIGAQGVDVLYRRSLHLTSSAFPWLANAGDHPAGTTQLASFKARLSDHEPAASAEASYVLLVTFTELLATLIGESLTERLLDPVWEPQSPASEREAAS